MWRPLGSCWRLQMRHQRTAAGSLSLPPTRSTARPSSAPSTAAGACSGASRCAATTAGRRPAARAWCRDAAVTAVRFHQVWLVQGRCAGPHLTSHCSLAIAMILATSPYAMRVHAISHTVHQNTLILWITTMQPSHQLLLTCHMPLICLRSSTGRSRDRDTPGRRDDDAPCRAGFAKSQPGGYCCVRCTRGSYASSTGTLHCRVCPFDTTSNAARTGCGALSAQTAYDDASEAAHDMNLVMQPHHAGAQPGALRRRSVCELHAA